VISGYLITSLLRREFERTETISLWHFYFRRTLRIFPPFYFFLAVMGVIWLVGWIPQDWRSFLAAATYTYALDPHATSYFIAHSWSLSIGEIFYLFWSLAFLIGHRRRNALWLAFAIILSMPVIRVALYFIAASLRGRENYMVQGWIDTVMVGCVLALLKGRAKWESFHLSWLNGWTAEALGIVGLFLMPALLEILPRPLSSFVGLGIKPGVSAACIGAVIVYLVEHPESFAGRILNNPAVRHIGVMSYSLYLWQQLFTLPRT
jgi:peptidoglycan/LPS O-acetylase OafA/YrhL